MFQDELKVRGNALGARGGERAGGARGCAGARGGGGAEVALGVASRRYASSLLLYLQSEGIRACDVLTV